MILDSTSPAIHNGQIVSDVAGVKTEQLPEVKTGEKISPDIEPNEIARLMAAQLSLQLSIDPKPTPMELVNGLLQLKNLKGEKLVFTRFDLFQIFAIWAKKLQQEGIRR